MCVSSCVRQTNSTMNKVCVGTKEEEKVVSGQSRKFTSMAKLLDGRGPLSTLVKMDVEGVRHCCDGLFVCGMLQHAPPWLLSFDAARDL